MRKICDGYFAEWFRITIAQNTRCRFSAFCILPSALHYSLTKIIHLFTLLQHSPVTCWCHVAHIHRLSESAALVKLGVAVILVCWTYFDAMVQSVRLDIRKISFAVKVVKPCNSVPEVIMGHFIFRWNQSLKPWFETRYRFETKIKPKHKVTLKFWFQTKLKLSSPVSNQTIVMYLDRRFSLIS